MNKRVLDNKMNICLKLNGWSQKKFPESAAFHHLSKLSPDKMFDDGLTIILFLLYYILILIRFALSEGI